MTPLRANPETWLPIESYEGIYQVSNTGRVRAENPPRGNGFLNGVIDRYGYRNVLLYKEGRAKRFKVHRLVCVAFHGHPPTGHIVGHLDADKGNNHADNLRWLTPRQNVRQAIADGAFRPPVTKTGTAHHSAKMTPDTVREARRLHSEGMSGAKLAKMFGINQPNMSALLRGETWRHV